MFGCAASKIHVPTVVRPEPLGVRRGFALPVIPKQALVRSGWIGEAQRAWRVRQEGRDAANDAWSRSAVGESEVPLIDLSGGIVALPMENSGTPMGRRPAPGADAYQGPYCWSLNA